jgi:hypothetical protein
MKRYKFLIKPLFYIFSLTASSYMVLVIEKISPSDFGRHQDLFVSEPKPAVDVQMVKMNYTKQYLKNVCFDYKYGIIDNATLDERLSTFIYGTQMYKQPPQIATIDITDEEEIYESIDDE